MCAARAVAMFTPPSQAVQQVEKATSELLSSPDWTTNLELCDILNSSTGQTKEVLKAVRKRISHKNPQTQLLALTLLETLVKNCGGFVHAQVVQRDILSDLVKIVKKKQPSVEVRDRILELLDVWQEAFGGAQGKFPEYFKAYEELQRSGVAFPIRDPDRAVPIFTPAQTHPIAVHNYRPPPPLPSSDTTALSDPTAAPSIAFSAADLTNARSTVNVLWEMLIAVDSHDPSSVRDELIVDLVQQCHELKRHLVSGINSTEDEELMSRMLELNDELQRALDRHDAIAKGEEPPPLDGPVGTEAEIYGAGGGVKALARFDQEEEEEDVDARSDFTRLANRSTVKDGVNQISASSPPVAAGVPPGGQGGLGLAPPPGWRGTYTPPPLAARSSPNPPPTFTAHPTPSSFDPPPSSSSLTDLLSSDPLPAPSSASASSPFSFSEQPTFSASSFETSAQPPPLLSSASHQQQQQQQQQQQYQYVSYNAQTGGGGVEGGGLGGRGGGGGGGVPSYVTPWAMANPKPLTPQELMQLYDSNSRPSNSISVPPHSHASQAQQIPSMPSGTVSWQQQQQAWSPSQMPSLSQQQQALLYGAGAGGGSHASAGGSFPVGSPKLQGAYGSPGSAPLSSQLARTSLSSPSPAPPPYPPQQQQQQYSQQEYHPFQAQQGFSQSNAYSGGMSFGGNGQQ